jgi:hypothetical protein
MKNINKFKMENIIYTNEKITKKKKSVGFGYVSGSFWTQNPLKNPSAGIGRQDKFKLC